MGSHYLKPHENGLRSLFKTANGFTRYRDTAEKAERVISGQLMEWEKEQAEKLNRINAQLDRASRVVENMPKWMKRIDERRRKESANQRSSD